MVQAARLIFQDLFNNNNKFKFNFDMDSRKNSVPMSSIMLLQMILEGTSVSLLVDNKKRDIAVGISSLSNLMLLNESVSKVFYVYDTKILNRFLWRVYWVIYSFKNSQKSMVNRFSSLGLCISSNLVDEI